MQAWIVSGVALVTLAWAGLVAAAPSIDIRGVAARVVIIPETRDDVVVTILRRNPRLPLKIGRLGQRVTITGDVGHHVHGCPMLPSGQAVEVRGRGLIAVDDLPKIAIRAPLDVRLSVGEAVFGSVGRTDTLNLANRGCGDWTIGNVKGHMALTETGQGAIRTGEAGSADLIVTGSGAITTRDIRDGLTAVASGVGDIDAASVSGPLTVRIAGSGDIRVKTGAAAAMSASIAGSGSVLFGGTARTLNASIVGSGNVRVEQVTGGVTKRVFGSGAVVVRVGNGLIAARPQPGR